MKYTYIVNFQFISKTDKVMSGGQVTAASEYKIKTASDFLSTQKRIFEKIFSKEARKNIAHFAITLIKEFPYDAGAETLDFR